MASIHPVLSRQPVKGLYLMSQFVIIAWLRLPIYVLWSIPRSWRPRESWGFARSIFARVLPIITGLNIETGGLAWSPMPNHLAIAPGVDVNGSWIEPIPERLIFGDVKTWAEVANVKPLRIPGYWIHKKGSKIPVGSTPAAGEKVVLSLHGGAYTLLTGHPTGPSAMIGKGLLQHVESVTRVLSLEYRLSVGGSKPQNPFPAALLDALAAYRYLVNEVGFSEKNIIVEGDSAGGNLSLALTRYLVENHGKVDGLPAPPGGVILLSPWVDFNTQIFDPESSLARNATSDYVGGRNAKYARGSVEAFVGPHGYQAALKNRYMCPASQDPELKEDFSGFPRTFICAGDAEVLLDSIRVLRNRMVASMGSGTGKGKVSYYEAKDCWPLRSGSRQHEDVERGTSFTTFDRVMTF